MATGSSESTLLAGWMSTQGIPGEPSRIQSGGTLWIIGHDYEIRDGRSAVRELRKRGFSAEKTRQAVLIVCSSAVVGRYGPASTAQNFAKYLDVPVYGSVTPVYMDSDMPMFIDDEPEVESFRRAGERTRRMDVAGEFYRFVAKPRKLFLPQG